MIEILVALLITTVGLLGALAMVGSLMQGSAFARNVSEASLLAQSKVEQLQSIVALPADGPQPQEINLDQFGVVQTTPPGRYTRDTTWATVLDSGVTRRTIVVTVRWQDSDGIWRAVSATGERVP